MITYCVDPKPDFEDHEDIGWTVKTQLTQFATLQNDMVRRQINQGAVSEDNRKAEELFEMLESTLKFTEVTKMEVADKNGWQRRHSSRTTS